MELDLSVQPTTKYLDAPTGSGYNEEWTFKLTPGQTFHDITLVSNLKHVETIKRITIDRGGEPVCYASNKQLDRMAKALSKFQTEGRFTFPLSKFEYRGKAGVYVTQLTTSIRDDVTVIVEVGAPGVNDPAKLEMKGRAKVTDSPSPLAPNGGGLYEPRMYELTQYTPAGGDHTWQFPSGKKSKHIQRMIFDETDLTISEVRVKRGGNTIHRVERADNDHDLQEAGIALQPGCMILDFTALGWGFEGALHSQGLNFEFIVSGPGGIKTYVEGFEQVVFPKKAA